MDNSGAISALSTSPTASAALEVEIMASGIVAVFNDKPSKHDTEGSMSTRDIWAWVISRWVVCYPRRLEETCCANTDDGCVSGEDGLFERLDLSWQGVCFAPDKCSSSGIMREALIYGKTLFGAPPYH